MHKSELQEFDGGFSFFAGHPTLSIPIIWYNQCNSSISLEFSWDLRMENRTHALCTPTTRHACSRLCYHPSWSWRKRKAFERHPVPKCIFDKKLLLQSVKCSKIQKIRKKKTHLKSNLSFSILAHSFQMHSHRMVVEWFIYIPRMDETMISVRIFILTHCVHMWNTALKCSSYKQKTRMFESLP